MREMMSNESIILMMMLCLLNVNLIYFKNNFFLVADILILVHKGWFTQDMG